MTTLVVGATGASGRLLVARLITDDAKWHRWKGRVPVIHG